MSIKKAQRIVNEVEDRLGITLVQFQDNELEWLKKQLEDFLDLEISTDELEDPSDFAGDDSVSLGLSHDTDGDDGESSFSHDEDDF